MKKAGRPDPSAARRLGGTLLVFGLFAACNMSQSGTQAGGPGTPVHAPPSTESLIFTFEQFPDATVDLTVDVVDSSTLATVFNQAAAAQATPFSVSVSYAPTPVTVTVSVKFNFLTPKALHNGTNSTPGLTLTDGAATFISTTYPPPLFVVDNPAAPTVLSDVLSIGSPTTLNLGAVFPAGPYYLFQTRQLSLRIDHTYVGTDSQVTAFTDDTLLTQQYTAAF